MVNGEICIGLFALREIKKVYLHWLSIASMFFFFFLLLQPLLHYKLYTCGLQFMPVTTLTLMV